MHTKSLILSYAVLVLSQQFTCVYEKCKKTIVKKLFCMRHHTRPIHSLHSSIERESIFASGGDGAK